MKKIVAVFILISLLGLVGCSAAVVDTPSSTQIKQVSGFYVSIYAPDCNDYLIFTEAFETARIYADSCNRQLELLNCDGTVVASDDFIELLRSILSASDSGSTPLLENLTDLWFRGDEPTLPSQEEIDAKLDVLKNASVAIDEHRVTVSGGAVLTLSPMLEYNMMTRIRQYLRLQGVTAARITVGNLVGTLGEFTVDATVSYEESEKTVGTLALSDSAAYWFSIYNRYFYVNDVLYHGILDAATGYPTDNDIAGLYVFFQSSASACYLGYTAMCKPSAAEARDFLADAGVDALILLKDGSYLTVGNAPFTSAVG